MQKSLQFLHTGAAIAVRFNTNVPCGALSRVQCLHFPSSEALFHSFSTEGEYMPKYPIYVVFTFFIELQKRVNGEGNK